MSDPDGNSAALAGDPRTVDEVVNRVYDELKRVAHGLLRGERAHRTLDTTALVHETYLRLARDPQVAAKGRAYFFGAAARAMRQILVDAARRRQRISHGGGAPTLSLSDLDSRAVEVEPELVRLDEALSRLESLHPRPARVIECRYFGGLSVEETAEALAVSIRTVKRDAALAQAWLYRELRGRET
jgi:RNA polymerase sigma-70 factor, ECF subfamily